MPTTECVLPNTSPRRGRRSSTPSTELGLCIQQHLDRLGITRTELAKRLHVSPSTVGRLLNGDTRVVQRVSVENICNALELNEIDRRVFLKLAGVASAGTFALATGAYVTRSTQSQEKTIDLDLAEDHANTLQRLLDRGDAQYVVESARRWYDRFSVKQPSRDIRLGVLQARFGILLGHAHEFVVPWYHRGQVAIQTYNAVESDVILRFDLKTMRKEYAILLARRAPLLREVGQYEESAAQFEDGIYWVKTVDDPLVRADLFRSRMHISAVQGDQMRWQRELEEARKDALFLDPGYQQEVFGLLDYVEGEGYKRFAYNTRMNFSIRMREAYAMQALQSFAQAAQSTSMCPDTQKMLMQVSEAQCLVWIDPQEAFHQVEMLRFIAEQQFPALVEKIDRVIYFARQRLAASRSDLPLLFDLDARAFTRAK
jgi:transcriptional regulator with XRE-family HTH domain